jgi:hypothetical protein
MCFILSTGNGCFTFRGRGLCIFYLFFVVAKLYFKNGRKDLKINNHSDIYKQKL